MKDSYHSGFPAIKAAAIILIVSFESLAELDVSEWLHPAIIMAASGKAIHFFRILIFMMRKSPFFNLHFPFAPLDIKRLHKFLQSSFFAPFLL